AEEICQGRGRDGGRLAGIVFHQDLARPASVPGEVDYLRPVAQQGGLKVPDAHRVLLDEIEALRVRCGPEALRDLADFAVESPARGVGRVGAQEEDRDLGGRSRHRRRGFGGYATTPSIARPISVSDASRGRPATIFPRRITTIRWESRRSSARSVRRP